MKAAFAPIREGPELAKEIGEDAIRVLDEDVLRVTRVGDREIAAVEERFIRNVVRIDPTTDEIAALAMAVASAARRSGRRPTRRESRPATSSAPSRACLSTRGP